MVVVTAPMAAPSLLSYFAARITVAPKQQPLSSASQASLHPVTLSVMQQSRQHPVQVPLMFKPLIFLICQQAPEPLKPKAQMMHEMSRTASEL